MADVDIVVDSGDLKAAIDLLKEYDMSFTKMVNQVQNEGNRLNRASKATASQVEQAWENAQKAIEDNKFIEATKKQEQTLKQFGVTFQNISKENIRSAKAEGQALKDLGKTAEELLREKVKLAAAFNPLLSAEQKYLDVKSRIAKASHLGVINAKQEAAALANLEREYQALNKGVYVAGSRFNQFGEQAGIAGKNANRFGMYAQQAGYQLGDFAVQIQSGTNAGVAFSQQFAQLAGLIPGVAGAVTTFGAIGLGLLIQNLSSGKKEAADTYAQLSAFEDLEAVFNSVGSSFETSMVQSISRVREEYGGFIADVAKFSLQKEMDLLKNNLNTVMDKATPFDPTAQSGSMGKRFDRWSMGSQGHFAGSYTPLQSMTEEANDYNEMLKQVEAAQERLFNGSINSKSEQVTAYKEFYETVQQIPGVTQEILDRIIEVGEESGIAAEAIKGIDEGLLKVNDRSREAFELYKKKNYELLRSGELLKVEQQYGKDSLQYLQAQHDQQLAILRSEMESAGVKDTLVDKIIEMQEAQYNIAEATYSWGNSLGYVKDQIAGVAAILSSIGGGMISNAEKFTTAKLIQEGATRLEAEKQVRYGAEDRKYEAQKQQNLAQYGKIIGTALNTGLSLQHEGGRNADEALLAAYELDSARSKSSGGGSGRKGSGGKGGSGRGKLSDTEKEAERATEKLEDFFDQFKQGMEQQERLLGVYGEQREELEKVIEIENRLGDARGLVSQKQIEAMANEELALERKLQREQEIYNLGSQNVENLLMTIVSGTSSIEDAFKAMLANIITEVYQSYVAKGAANVAGNAIVSLFSAKGNAFGSGGVKMFAKGGVVNSPTLFGYNNGKTGMMGEAGPEAIMPLKRNSQGRLGVEVSGNSSNPINISNVFNLSANGDESVNRIIQAQIPKITEASTKAVIEARRRGRNGL